MNLIADDHLVNQQEFGAKLDITMIVRSMKRGNRSTRQRRKSSVPWVEQLGFDFRNVERACQNDQAVGSEKMKRTRRGTKSLCMYNRGAKGKRVLEVEVMQVTSLLLLISRPRKVQQMQMMLSISMKIHHQNPRSNLV